MGITEEKVDQYIQNLLPIKDPLLKELYEEGIRDEIPIIQVPSITFLESLLNIIKPEIIIELGTAIAFSTIWLAKAMPNSTVHTIERKAEMVTRARENISKAGLEERIILHDGDVVNVLPTLPKSKFIFIDAAKGKYKEFFELAYPLLEDGGMIVFDNILFRGYIADDEVVRTKPMLRKIRRFNEFIANHPEVHTSFVPIGDGLAICTKMEETS